MYFHTDSERTLKWLAEVLLIAHAEGRSVRLMVESDNSLKVKVGEGMWTAPIGSTEDPYRDVTAYQHTHVSVEDGSPAMAIRQSDGTITLMNEDGHVWTDPAVDWKTI